MHEFAFSFLLRTTENIRLSAGSRIWISVRVLAIRSFSSLLVVGFREQRLSQDIEVFANLGI